MASSLQKGFAPEYMSVIDRVANNMKTLMPNASAAGIASRQASPIALPSLSPARTLAQPTLNRSGNPFLDALSGRRSGGLGAPMGGASHLGAPQGFQARGSTLGDSNAIFAGVNARYNAKLKAQSDFSDSSGNELPSGGNPADARGIDGSLKYKDVMTQVQNESGVPWQILAAIMGIETGGENKNDPGGAAGLMQIMPNYWQGTADKYGGNLSDPYTNIRTAADILKQNYDTYGSWEKAAAAYFGGGGAINADGSYSAASDSYGTNINDYVSAFKGNLTVLGYGAPSAAEQANGGRAATGWADSAVQAAMSMQGTPYVLGGEDPGKAFDCSGLMQWAYSQVGKELPRTAAEQFAATQRINPDQLQPGDLIFFSGTTDAPGVTHVGMYIGNGQMLQAPKEGDVVKISSLNNDFWQSHTYGYGRVI